MNTQTKIRPLAMLGMKAWAFIRGVGAYAISKFSQAPI